MKKIFLKIAAINILGIFNSFAMIGPFGSTTTIDVENARHAAGLNTSTDTSKNICGVTIFDEDMHFDAEMFQIKTIRKKNSLQFAQELYKKCFESMEALRNNSWLENQVAEQNKRSDFCRMFVKLALKEEFYKNKK